MVVARVEVQWSIAEIAHRFGMASIDAARVAVSRSLKRLSAQFNRVGINLHLPIPNSQGDSSWELEVGNWE
jgi:hypothetical protein